MKKKTWLVLIAIVLLGGLLRFWQLGQYPVSLSIDETSLAYNAYSILKTARDEHNQFLPLAFRSVWDFKPPVLIYSMVPAMALFGLNEFGTRFTIALIGTLTIIFVYLLTKELTKNEVISLITSFSLAISPWHVHLSRGTFGTTLASFFMIIGAWLFLRAMRLKGKWLWLSALFFVLSLYTYHAERIVVPVLVLGMAVLFRQKLWQYKRATLLAIVVGLIALLPLLTTIIGPGGKTRATTVFLSRDAEIAGELEWSEDFSGFPKTIFNNKPLILFNFWLKRYLDYWDLNFLFLDGMQFTLPGMPGVGLFHFFEIFLFLLGIWLVFFQKKPIKKEGKMILVLWLLLGPLAASLANNPQHTIRSLTTMPAPQILVGVGGWGIYTFIKQQKSTIKLAAVGLTALALVVSLVYFIDIYFLHFPVHFSEYWSYGMKETALYAWQHHHEYEEVVVDPQFMAEGETLVGVPYLYFLFYGQYEPSLFQNSPRRKVKTQDSVDFENFTFREIYWPKDRFKKETLFIGSPWSLPLDEIKPGQILKEVKFKNGRLGFLIVASD